MPLIKPGQISSSRSSLYPVLENLMQPEGWGAAESQNPGCQECVLLIISSWLHCVFLVFSRLTGTPHHELAHQVKARDLQSTNAQSALNMKYTLLIPPKSPAQWQVHKGSQSCQTVLANSHKSLDWGSTANVKCFPIERCCFIYILHNPFIKRRPFNVGAVCIMLHKPGSFSWQS